MNTICTVTTIKAPLLDTIMFVNYHLNLGINRLFLYFDDPDDPAISYLKNHDRITCIRCTEEYWRSHPDCRTFIVIEKQKINAQDALAMAREQGFGWIAHIDADELIFSGQDIKNVLRQTTARILRFEIHEAVPEKKSYPNIFNDVTLFKKNSSDTRKKWARMLGCRKFFYAGRYFRGHAASKNAVRTNLDIAGLGIHRPIMMDADEPIADTRRIKLLHFDCCGLDAWKTKWLQRLRDTPESSRRRSPARNMQLKEFRNAYAGPNREEKLLELYNRLYGFPRYEKMILSGLNMLTRIRINQTWFEGPIKINSSQ